MEKKSIAIIGLGRFGMTMAKAIAEMDHEVMGIDIDEDVVQRISPYITHAAVADTTDEDALRALSLNQFDVVVVAISDNLEANLMTAMLLKELGVKYVVAKSQDKMQGKMLDRIGVDLVVYPECDMALRISQMLTRNHVVDYLTLSKDIGLVEMETPKFLVGKTLIESNLRESYNLSVVALKRGDEIIVPPDPKMVLEKMDLLMLIGRDADISKLEKE